MPFVLDSSVALAWALPDENEASLDILADRLLVDTAIAPAIWPLEVANALLVARRRGRISKKEVEQVLEQVARLPVTVEPAEPRNVFDRVFELAGKHDMTAYDASYLELASRRQIALATLDRKLRDAGEAVGVALLP